MCVLFLLDFTSPTLLNEKKATREKGRKLGELGGEGGRFISKELLLAYFADERPISEKVKLSVAAGLSSLLSSSK